MAMKQCKESSKEISSKAEPYLNGGAVLKRKTELVTCVMVGLLLLVCISVIGCPMNGSTTSTKPEAGLKLPGLGKQVVTFDEYNQIQNKMSYRRIVAIIGAEGEEISRNKIDGVPEVMESIETIMYQWVNSNGSNMNAILQNDELFQKAQFGLK